MTSIATKTGDGGTTALAGGVRVSKSSLRVEAYGGVDELGAALGFARSIGTDAALCDLTRQIQGELFAVGAALARAGTDAAAAPAAPVTAEMVERLTDEVHRLEAIPGLLSDWSIPGDSTAAAAYDVARTVCRRAERELVRLI